MSVNRCVCMDLAFEELLSIARDNGLTYEELSARTGCGRGCGLCGPYVKLMLRTGRTSFEPMALPVLMRRLEEAERSAAEEASRAEEGAGDG